MNPFPELNKTKVRSQCSNQLFNALKDSARKRKCHLPSQGQSSVVPPNICQKSRKLVQSKRKTKKITKPASWYVVQNIKTVEAKAKSTVGSNGSGRDKKIAQNPVDDADMVTVQGEYGPVERSMSKEEKGRRAAAESQGWNPQLGDLIFGGF